MISVSPIKQSDSSRCGPTAVRMILAYYGVDATEDELCTRCGHTFEKGCTDQGMVKALKSYGLEAKIFNNCDLSDLEYWVRHHFPVIVDYFASGNSPEEVPDGHSGVVVDVDRENVYLIDPRIARQVSIDRKDFMQSWFDWRGTSYLQRWQDMVLRQLIVAYPKRLLGSKR